MKKAFTNKIKKLLEEEQQQIVARAKSNANVDIDIDGDETDEIQGKIIALANRQLIARDKEKLMKIEAAYRKIADGTYGVCSECEELVSEKRLLFNPIFDTCISCAEQIELMKKKNRI